jgi:hypothetical protein
MTTMALVLRCSHIKGSQSTSFRSWFLISMSIPQRFMTMLATKSGSGFRNRRCLPEGYYHQHPGGAEEYLDPAA